MTLCPCVKGAIYQAVVLDCSGFQCDTGLCLWDGNERRCNEVFDCPDLSDEMGCRKSQCVCVCVCVCVCCLLYTSPSPRDVHKSRMPSSA